jgi:hypothetical protein
MAKRRVCGRPGIVCLVGSARFYDQYQRATLEETLAGKIVLSMAFGPDGNAWDMTDDDRERMEALHLWKIRMANEVLVINKGGYVGASTSSQLLYALALNKRIRWMEAPPASLFAMIAPGA